MRKLFLSFALFFLTVAVFPLNSQAVTLTYEATDLFDTTVGEDLWQYKYSLGGYTFNTGYGFSIDFALGQYDQITPVSVSADWSILALQPDAGIPANGVYDAQALVDGASLATPFIVNFVWLGAGSPDSQSFLVYDPTFATIPGGTGSSTPPPPPGPAPIPEPGTLMLLVGGLACLAAASKARFSR